jgi:zinc transporter ZupT
MSSDNSLRIAGIFITLVASVVGFAIPYIRGVPKDHDDALSTSWMSLKAYSSGVILSVAVIHLLGEALHVLEEVALLHALEDAHDHVHEGEAHSDEHEEEGAHGSFPIGLCLCLAGIALTLGIELFASFFIDDSSSENTHSTSNQFGVGGGKVEMSSIALSHSHGSSKCASYGAVCDDPYRLENGHTHHNEDHVICDASKKCSHESERACSSSCHTHDHNSGTHSKGSDSQMPTQEQLVMVTQGHDHGHEHMHTHQDTHVKRTAEAVAAAAKDKALVPSPSSPSSMSEMEVGCILDAKTDSIHRHVSIVVENPQRSILKSILLEAAVAIHSVIIGVSMGSSDEGIEVLLVAYAFHQLFEGVSIGSASLEAGYSKKTALIFMAIFALSVPIGIIIGLNIPSTTEGMEVQAWFACLASGSLIYTALVEMVADDFSHFVHSHGHGHKSASRSSRNKTTAIAMYFSFVAGLVCMVVLAKWA